VKPKANRKTDAHESQPMDCLYTPAYAVDPLLPYLRKEWTIWEPAAGEGHLTRALEAAGHRVIATEIRQGQNFFTYTPDHFDCIVTNPPYSIKADWLERCYQLGKPFALLIPVETVGARGAQKWMERYGAEFNWLDKRVNFITPNQGSGAQFPTYWHSWRLVGQPVSFWKITRRADEQLSLLEAA
jgi:hypothetical protein